MKIPEALEWPSWVRFIDRYGDNVVQLGGPPPPDVDHQALPPITPPNAQTWEPQPGWAPPVPICDRVVCTGRPVDRDGVAAGKTCGTRWHAGCDGCHRYRNLDRIDQDTRLELASARAAGWRIGPADERGVHNAMCPRCAAPDPAMVKMCAELAARSAGEQLALAI